MKEKLGKEVKGITLIALVITIIVLLILAGVSIAMLTGNNGILTQASNAKETNDLKSVEEKGKLLVTYAKSLDNSAKLTKENFEIAIDKENENGTNIKDLYYYGENAYLKLEGKVIYVDLNTGEVTLGNNPKYQIGGYVEEGLILRYDGILNTRNGNDPDAKIWEDLTENKNDGVLNNNNKSINYLENEKGYEFTNNADYIETTNELNLLSNPDVTFEFVYKWYGFQTGQQEAGLFTTTNFAVSEGRSFTLWMGKSQNRTLFATVNTNVSNNTLPTTNIKNSISLVKKKGNFSIDNAFIYEDGKKTSNNSMGNSSMYLSNIKMQIGRMWQWSGRNRTLNGILYSVRVYNKVLSEEEIKQNYELDKVRFEL